LVLFIATVTVVGVRMLLLARRTRGRHELLIGAGMVLIGTIGYPAGIASGFGRAVGEMSLPIWFAGTFITQIGITMIFAFTWQVFRPAERWGKAIVVAGALIMLASLLASTYALVNAAPEANSQAVVRTPIFLGMIGYSGCFLWTAIEGLVQYRNARRRLALGLADAIVVNRFLLWALFGLCATAINIASLTGNAMGVDPSRSLLVLGPMGVFGFVASVAMYLAFLPPAAYLARIRGKGVAAS
jgi:hypothetical protein